MGKDLEQSKHHLIQRCEKNDYNVHDKRNVKKMIHKQHVALHQLFRNLTTPKDQLVYLRDLYDTVLSPYTKQLFDDLINMPEDFFYAQ